MLDCLFNKVPFLTIHNFIKKRLQHRLFPVNVAEFKSSSCLVTPPVAAFGYSNQLQIFREIATSNSKDNMLHNSISEGLCPATKTEIDCGCFLWNFVKF